MTGVSEQALSAYILQERVNRVRAMTLRRWGLAVQKLEGRIEALEKAVAEAYWKGHGDGRIWGKKPISAETFEIGGRAIHAALAAHRPDVLSGEEKRG